MRAKSWKEREQLLAYGLYLQPGLAALDVAARIWRDLSPKATSTAGGASGGPTVTRRSGREARR